jgi:RNA polymerase sigma-70 factor (ECF subfamily)
MTSPAPVHAFTDDIYQRYGTSLLRFARMLTLGDIHAAEDLVQEAVLRAWRHSDRLHATPGLTRPWLFTVVRRLVIDAHRARAVRPAETDDAELATRAVSDQVDQVLTSRIVLDALQGLEPQHRDVIVHRFLLDHSVEETAAELDIPAGTVKSRSHKALRFLRTELTADAL